MNNRSLPKPLGLSRILPDDVVFDHYIDEADRDQRLLGALDWVQERLELFMPLSPMQKVSLKKIVSALTRHDAIEAEKAIAELILLEEPVLRGRDKFGRKLEE
jgi:hypothetical protein